MNWLFGSSKNKEPKETQEEKDKKAAEHARN